MGLKIKSRPNSSGQSNKRPGRWPSVIWGGTCPPALQAGLSKPKAVGPSWGEQTVGPLALRDLGGHPPPSPAGWARQTEGRWPIVGGAIGQVVGRGPGGVARWSCTWVEARWWWPGSHRTKGPVICLAQPAGLGEEIEIKNEGPTAWQFAMTIDGSGIPQMAETENGKRPGRWPSVMWGGHPTQPSRLG